MPAKKKDEPQRQQESGDRPWGGIEPDPEPQPEAAPDESETGE